MNEQELLDKAFSALKLGNKSAAYKFFKKADKLGSAEASFQMATLLADKAIDIRQRGITKYILGFLSNYYIRESEKSFERAERRRHILVFSRRELIHGAYRGTEGCLEILELINRPFTDKEEAFEAAEKALDLVPHGIHGYQYQYPWTFYVPAANLGHTEAQYYVGSGLVDQTSMGMLQRSDSGFYKSSDAENYLNLAAKNGHVASHITLIEYYLRYTYLDPERKKVKNVFDSLAKFATRQGIPEDRENYKKVAQKIRDHLDKDRLFKESNYYSAAMNSWPEDQKQEEARIETINKAIASKTPEENLAFGKALLRQGKHEDALLHLQAAADLELPEAETQVGILYSEDKFKDKDKALSYLRKAADRNYFPAQIALLDIYDKDRDALDFYKSFDAIFRRHDDEIKSLDPATKVKFINTLYKNGFHEKMFHYLDLFAQVDDDFKASAVHMKSYYQEQLYSRRHPDIPPTTSKDTVQDDTYTPHQPRSVSPQPARTQISLPQEVIEKFEKFGTFLANTHTFAGREKEIRTILRALKKENKPNALLIGEAGVGKTAIVEEVARRCAQEGKLVFNLDIPSLISGTMWRGDFEKNMKELISLAEEYRYKVIIFADEFHMLMGAGRTSDSSMDVSNMLKQALSRGTISMIGATTTDELKKYVQKDGAILRRFHIVRVPEPNRDETLSMLNASAPKLIERGVMPATGVFEKVYDLSKRYLPNRNMPDVAYDVVENAVELLLEERRSLVLDESAIARIISDMSGVPSQDMLNEGSDRILGLAPFMKGNLVGQDSAIDQFSKHLMNVWAGLSDANRGVRAAFLFSGPTGVGKTETVTLLSEFLGINLVNINMSEYMEKHSVSRLIGAPPGYEGYQAGGVLTEAVSKAPFSIILLDEVEKAHPDIFNVFLQVLDKGLMKDGTGKDIDFRSTMIVMTTNAGQADIKNGLGFINNGNDDAPGMAIAQFFSPEFRARLDGVVEYKKLFSQEAQSIAKLFLEKASAGLKQSRSISLDFDESVAVEAAQAGFSSAEGARPMKKYIRDKVMSVLTMPLLEKKIKNGDSLRILFNTKLDEYEWSHIEGTDVDQKPSDLKLG